MVAALLWLVLISAVFTSMTIATEKPSLASGIGGGWLLIVVATQAIAVLIALLGPHWDESSRQYAEFVALSMWLWGGMVYIWIIALILYRYLFFRFSPEDLAPTDWINMGAMAISVLAGSLLVMEAPTTPFLHSLQPFLEGLTILYWATGNWWIPMLVILSVWRYAVRRTPIVYDPLYWGAVFPLGMYAASTFTMAHAMPLGFLTTIPRVVFWIALAAWLATFAAMVADLVRLPPAPVD